MVSSISSVSEEQAHALTNISIRVDEITDVIHTNSATSEESAASSEELSSQANIMKMYINEFKIKSCEDITLLKESLTLNEDDKIQL